MTGLRVFNIEVVRLSLLTTVKVNGMVFFIILNSSMINQLLACSGASSGMPDFAASF